MASTFIPTKLKMSQVVTAGPQLKFDTAGGGDTFKVLIVQAGGGIPVTDSSGVQFVGDITATNAEVAGALYARQTLASVTVAYDASPSNFVDFSFANIIFVQDGAGFNNGRYIVFYDNTVGANDAAHPVIAVCDPGQTLNSITGQITLQSPVGGLIQWQ